MQVHVHNRKQVATLEPRENVWVISIHTPDDEPAPLVEGWERVDRFCFSDIAGDNAEMMLWAQELRERLGRTVVFFNSEMALEIINILMEAQASGKDLIVHCDAGVSRSQAVARFARQAMGATVLSHTIGVDHVANSLVLRHLNRLVWREAVPGFKPATEEGTFTLERDEEEWDID